MSLFCVDLGCLGGSLRTLGALWSCSFGLLGFMVLKHLEITFPYSWEKKWRGNQKWQSQRSCWRPGPALTAPAPVPGVGGVCQPPPLHLGCSDLCLGILSALPSSHFPASAEHPEQPLHRPAPCCSPQPLLSPWEDHCPHTLCVFLCQPGVLKHFYFPSRGFRAHSCPQTHSAPLPTQAGFQSGSPSTSLPVEAPGLLVWHRVCGTG